MASTLPTVAGECCPPACTEPTSIQVPGPAGIDGTSGVDGDPGVSPFTTFTTAAFVIPAELANGVATVADTSWMVISQKLYGSRVDGSIHAFFEVAAIGGPTSVTLKNLEDAATSAYTENSAPGSTLTVGSYLGPAGIQGPSGLLSGGAAGGDLKGTYPNPLIATNNALGALLVGNGTDSVSVPAGTNGHMLAYDSTDAEGIKSFAALPLTGGTDVSKSRIARLSATTGLPVPLVSSRAQINDPGSVAAGEVGALVLDASSGNARGTDAVELQVNRGAGVDRVASGNRSFIGGGENNRAVSTESVVVGGDSNVAGVAGVGERCAVVGGDGNAATGDESFIGGGNQNTASGVQSCVCGGDSNTAGPLQESAICGGASNVASGAQSFVGGGNSNDATGLNSTVCGGAFNTASQALASVLGGSDNTASGPSSTVIGGEDALADKHGQVAHASGSFATGGDAQAFDLVWRATTVATNADIELYLDGATATQRATISVGKTWAFHILVVARSAAGVGAAWEIKGAIQNNAGTTALVSAVTTAVIADGTGATWGVAANVVVAADNANDSIRIGVAVTVDPAVTVRWVATGRVVEVGH